MARQAAEGLLIRVSFDHQGGARGAGNQVSIEAGEIPGYLARGSTVCADPIDRCDPALAGFAAAVKAQLGHAGGISFKAYLSPDGAGFNTHFDTQINTTLQIEGKKRWRYSTRPAVAFPLNNGFLDATGAIRYIGRLPSSVKAWELVEPVDEAGFTEVVLGPGDVLCLPAGTWHDAKAIGGSLSLNLAFAPFHALDLLDTVLGRLMAGNPEWRRGLPLAPADPARPDVLPPGLEQFIGARLDELREALAGLDPRGALLQGIWRDRLLEPAVQASGSPAVTRYGSGPSRRRTAGPASTGEAGSAGAGASGLRFDGGLTCSMSVKSLEESIGWYRKALGLNLVYVMDEFGWGEMATEVPGVNIGLSEVPNPEVRGGAMLTFGVTDLDAARRELESRGVRFHGPTQVIQGVVKLAGFADPDGNRLMLFQSLRGG